MGGGNVVKGEGIWNGVRKRERRSMKVVAVSRAIWRQTSKLYYFFNTHRGDIIADRNFCVIHLEN